jgi:elongation factor G
LKSYETNKIRNTCLVGHGGSGKTSLAEVMLFNTGAIKRVGKVTDGNTVSDFLQEEIQRHISISTALIPVESNGTKINVLDTPGYSDFIGEVISALRVVESAVLVLCGVGGVEVQAEIIWDMMEEKGLPRFIFINKLDRENSNAEKVVEQLTTIFPDTRFVQMQIPVGKEENFEKVIDIFQSEIPDEYKDDIETLKETLTEAAAEADDEILMKYLEGESLSLEELKEITRKAIAQNMMVPILFGSVEKNIGVKELTQFICRFCPNS